MPAIGVTGGIGTGKSSFVNCLRREMSDAAFFDADEYARHLVRDPAVAAEIRTLFGPQVFTRTEELNREALRAIIFAEPAKRLALEEILHPRIRNRWSAEAQRYRNTTQIFVADIPLLYETSGESLCSKVVVVACAEELQLARVMQRMQLSKADALAMIATQLPLEEKIRRADYVIWNNGPLSLLAKQAAKLARSWK